MRIVRKQNNWFSDSKFILALLIVYYFNNCTSAFFKAEGLTLLIWMAFACWLIFTVIDQPTFFFTCLGILMPLAFCFIILMLSLLLEGLTHVQLNNIRNLSNLIMLSCIFSYYIKNSKVDGGQRVKVAFVFWAIDTGIACVYSIIRLIEDPLLARFLAGHMVENSAGVITYANVYGIALLIPVLFGTMLGMKKRWKWMLLLPITFLFVTLYYAQFTLSILLSLLGVFIVLAAWYGGKSFRSKKGIIILLLFVAVIVLIAIFGERILEANIIPLALNERLYDLYNFLFRGVIKENTDFFIRFSFYKQSIDTAISNFFLGAFLGGVGEGGEHSEILDLIANYGIFYFALYFVFFIAIYRLTKKQLDVNCGIIYDIVVVLFFLFAIVNTALWAPLVVVVLGIIPMLLCTCSKGENYYQNLMDKRGGKM